MAVTSKIENNFQLFERLFFVLSDKKFDSFVNPKRMSNLANHWIPAMEFLIDKNKVYHLKTCSFYFDNNSEAASRLSSCLGIIDVYKEDSLTLLTQYIPIFKSPTKINLPERKINLSLGYMSKQRNKVVILLDWISEHPLDKNRYLLEYVYIDETMNFF